LRAFRPGGAWKAEGNPCLNPRRNPAAGRRRAGRPGIPVSRPSLNPGGKLCQREWRQTKSRRGGRLDTPNSPPWESPPRRRPNAQGQRRARAEVGKTGPDCPARALDRRVRRGARSNLLLAFRPGGAWTAEGNPGSNPRRNPAAGRRRRAGRPGISETRRSPNPGGKLCQRERRQAQNPPPRQARHPNPRHGKPLPAAGLTPSFSRGFAAAKRMQIRRLEAVVSH